MEKFDVIIIGGGSAGLPAAIYAARFNLKTLVIVKERGGLLTSTHLVENWPGEIAISGLDLMEKIEKIVEVSNVKKWPIPFNMKKDVEAAIGIIYARSKL